MVADQNTDGSIGLRSLLDYARQRQDVLKNDNRFLKEAMESDKRTWHRIATIARTIALVLIGLLLPYLNPRLNVLFYEFILLAFIATGWLQLRFAQVGRSRIELAFIILDLALLTLVATIPNPFLAETIPAAFVYRFDNFIYFFVLLATATLAYSWRTVLTMGVWVALLWTVALIAIGLFGLEIPELSIAAQKALSGYPIVAEELDPNGAQVPVRVQEIVVFMIVSAILALNGWRSNQLLVRQAGVAAERANLSRYFAPNMVDVLASSDHDIGAVRSQDVAVMFTDIVGFTKIAERHSPDVVMPLLRQYHSVVEKSVFENDGTLDKYLGDGVMATFGTPNPGRDDPLNAVRAARQILEEWDRASRKLQGTRDIRFRVSIGINFGPVILGDIGPSRRLEFAVIGDTVNVASRLESATRSLNCRIVVSNSLYQRICEAGARDDPALAGFEFVSELHLRGRSAPADIWKL